MAVMTLRRELKQVALRETCLQRPAGKPVRWENAPESKGPGTLQVEGPTTEGRQ